MNRTAPSGTKSQLQELVVNLLPKNVRLETLEDREHVVVPMIMLTEGVHAGTGGPLYYPEEQLAKTPAVWNQKPIVVYHPEMNGRPISACDPVIVNSRKIGVIMNATCVGGKLKAEAWIERNRADKVDPRIMQAVDAAEMMELSTGVFVDEEGEPGIWNTEAYDATATNYRPDHLALLPDQIGACSISDGAGFLRNNRAVPAKKRAELERELVGVLNKLGITSNVLSFSNIRDALSKALMQRLSPAGKTEPDKWAFIEDVYPSFFIFEQGEKLFRLPYESTDTGVTIPADEEPVPVVRVTEYRTEAGAFVGNTETNDMTKKDAVDAIIANSKVWTEKHRDTLMAMSEDQLGTIKEQAQPADKTPATPAPAKPDPAPTGNAETPTTAPKPQTAEEYIAAAPKEIREVLTNGREAYEAQKTELVQDLVSIEGSPYTQEELQEMPLANLRRIHGLVRAVKPVKPAPRDFSGLAPLGNATEEEPLAVPSLVFTK